MSTAIEEKIKFCADSVTKRLREYLANEDSDTDRIREAMRYSTEAGGKRIRPFLVLTMCGVFHGNSREAMVYACALEMIHTYSLIHDDLPCMDDDDLRRGKPTCHKVYGEATAMLAGDALLTRAFEIITEAPGISDIHKVKAISILSRRSGVSGMIGGQQMDLVGENSSVSYETMTKTHMLKTGALMEAACLLGALSANTDDPQILADISCYAEGIGRVFQLVDDLLDVSATADVLGKNIRSDEKNHKTTYLTFMPAEIASGLADVMTEKAVEAISSYDTNGILTDLAEYLRKRTR